MQRMHTRVNNIPFPSTTEEVNWDFHLASENLTNLVSDTAKPDIILTVNNVISFWEPKIICRSGQRECSWSFPRFENQIRNEDDIFGFDCPVLHQLCIRTCLRDNQGKPWQRRFQDTCFNWPRLRIFLCGGWSSR